MQSGNKIDSCKRDKTNCLTVLTPNAVISVDAEHIIVETVNSIIVESKKDITQIRIEATNMNMGTIYMPLSKLVSDQNKNIYESTLFMGMCSEPKMEWKMTIEYADKSVELATIQSYWNKELASESF